MPYILIQVNEGIAKFFTLMVGSILTKWWNLNAIDASSWDICIHRETYEYFLKYLFHAQYNMPYILIQVNEGIAKFLTLMVEGLI